MSLVIVLSFLIVTVQFAGAEIDQRTTEPPDALESSISEVRRMGNYDNEYEYYYPQNQMEQPDRPQNQIDPGMQALSLLASYLLAPLFALFGFLSGLLIPSGPSFSSSTSIPPFTPSTSTTSTCGISPVCTDTTTVTRVSISTTTETTLTTSTSTSTSTSTFTFENTLTATATTRTTTTTTPVVTSTVTATLISTQTLTSTLTSTSITTTTTPSIVTFPLLINLVISIPTVSTTTVTITIILPNRRTLFIEAADPSFYDLQNEIPDTAYDFYDDQEEQQNMGKLMVQLNQTTTSPVVAGSINYETPNDQENEIRGTFIPRVTESSIRRFSSYFIRQ